MKKTDVSEFIERIAPEMGISVVLDPDFRFVGEMCFPNGKRHLFTNDNLNINSSASEELARDKGYTHYFLRAAGIDTPRWLTFFSDRTAAGLPPEKRRGIADAVDFAHRVGYPVFVKPNNLLEGKMVYKACDDRELEDKAAQILAKVPVAVAEECRIGNDYRVVVLGHEIISAYQRRPLSVVGNGVDDVATLLRRQKENLAACGRPGYEINPGDERIDACLRRQGLDRSHVPASGKCIRLLDNANISTGGTAVELTGKQHSSFAALAVAATQALGLRYSGVDLLCADLTAPSDRQEWTIIEVNGAPDLDNYASVGEEQETRLKTMYGKIFAYIEGL